MDLRKLQEELWKTLCELNEEDPKVRKNTTIKAEYQAKLAKPIIDAEVIELKKETLKKELSKAVRR